MKVRKEESGWVYKKWGSEGEVNVINNCGHSICWPFGGVQ